MNTIGERLAWARQAAGLSVSQVAKMLQTTPEIIRNLESGKTDANFAALGQFAQLYGMSYEWLAKGIEKHVEITGFSKDVPEREIENLRRLLARME